MNGFQRAAGLLPEAFRIRAEGLPEREKERTEEFRLRLGRAPSRTTDEGETPLSAVPVTRQQLNAVFDRATRSSPYSVLDSLRQGYVTAPGGIRVGLCGHFSDEGGAWSTGGLSSVNIRIPRQIMGVAAPLCRGEFVSTLIVSPPGRGKTTLLRDMVRLLSGKGYRVGLCDERGELAALTEEGFGFDVGPRTDVISYMEKHAAAVRLLRLMNPQILAMDEITEERDAAACLRAWGCGVALLATAHAGRREELERKPVFSRLLREGVFRRLIWIERGERGRACRVEAL